MSDKQPPHELLTPYWIEAKDSAVLGRGVTAFSKEDAFDLLRQAGFDLDPAASRVHEGIAFADLDQKHVVPNMGIIVRRGIWYPNLNSSS